MQIQPAEPADLESVLEIVALCTADLQSQGIDQWDDFYPTRALIEGDLNAGSLYVGRIDRRIVGAVGLDDIVPEPFLDVKWSQPEERALIVHRLCVHPEWQGHGIARQLMDFAESLAVDRGYRWIRLDAYPANPRAIQIYERRGYERRGQVNYVRRRRYPFECFEKRMSRTP